ncbi:MAG: VTT domain-containing protein [Bryobacteraceae bacterium]
MKHLADVLIHFGPVGVFLLAILESSGLPIPAMLDIALTLLAWKSPVLAFPAAALAVAGSMIGNIALFQAARFGGSRFIKAPDPHTPRRFQQWFQRYGLITVFVPAVLPIPLPLKVFVITAGVLRTTLARFIAVVVVARTIRYFGLAWLGVSLGEDAAGFLKRNLWTFTGAAAALVLVLFVLVWLADRRSDGANVTIS